MRRGNTDLMYINMKQTVMLEKKKEEAGRVRQESKVVFCNIYH